MQRVGVLFMQSQEFFGADSQIHASIMRHLPRDRFDVHCAVPAGDVPCASAAALAKIPDLALRPTFFGPSVEDLDRRGKVLALARHGLPMTWNLLALARYARRHGVRVVHCTEKPRDAVLGRIVARLAGADCVIHVHVKAATWIRPEVRNAMSKASALIGVSEFVAESITDLLGDRVRVHAVLNGLELADWETDDIDPATVRRELGVPPGAPLIVSASRLFRHKGQHELIAAMPSVLGRFPDTVLLVVGADDTRTVPGEGSYSDTLRRLCDQLGVADHVDFAGWRSDVRRLMAASDVYAMPSFEEPFGMVFIEAMYLRRPVVALDNGGTREVVEHGRCGLLSAPGDTAAIAANIVRLLEDPDLRREMGERGRRRVVEVLNSVRMANDVAAVYESLPRAAATG